MLGSRDPTSIRICLADGYGAVTVSPSGIEPVLRYIANQMEHHRERTFQEEYLDLLQQSGIEFDERYLW